ncbi:MAG: 6-hydroxymethylpterin diphosphokinase MptE-like protein [Pseudomonadota bacterium]
MELVQDYFESNLSLLKKHQPQAWQAVKDYTGTPFGEFCLAANGQVNLLVHGENGEEILIHDAQNPEAELETFYRLVPEESNGAVIFIGMGLGYGPLAMMQSRRQVRQLAILVPEPGLFLRGLHALDLTALLTDRRLLIALGPEIDVSTVTAAMGKALLLESVHILNHLAESRINLPVYVALYDEVYKQTNTTNISGNTNRTYGEKFVDNRFRHLSSIHHQHLLDHLQGAFSGVPAFIVAAGPSLNKNIHLLPEAQGKAVIIGVDTVLPALLAQGVTPDFTTAIDMQDIVLEKIVDVSAQATGTSLVCAAWVNPAIPKNFPARQVYWTYTVRPIEHWLNSLLGGQILTGGAGTVAHLSFTAAVMLGCSPIVFVGQDLAYTDDQDHAMHTSLTERDGLKRHYETDAIELVDAYGGGKVPTTRAWVSDRHYFEWAINATPDRQFINATEGGVRIKGTEELSLQEVLSKYCQKDVDKAAMLQEVEQPRGMSSRRKMVDEFKRQLKTIATVEKDMSKVEALCSKLAKEIGRLKQQGGGYTNFDALPKPMRLQINDLDVLNNSLDKAKVWHFLEEVTMNGLLQSERLFHDVNMLEGQKEHYLEWLTKSMERFVTISLCRRQVLAPFKQHLKHLVDQLPQEEQLLKRLGKKGEEHEAVHSLLRLYHDNGDYVLMERLIAERCPDHAGSAELSFYLGTIAAHQSQFAKAEQCFALATALDASWADRVADCRLQLGDQYLRYSREWRASDQGVARRMLFKGFRINPEHPELRGMLVEEMKQVLGEAEAVAGQAGLVGMTEQLAIWCRELVGNPNLVAAFGVEGAALLHRYHGNALVAKQEYALAATAFAAAIALTPQEPELHLLHADAFFALDDFVSGMASLDRAVALDPQYAAYWENMGDNLFRNTQPVDAIAAYQRCLQSLAERLHLLKKIGDCYMAMDQIQAAQKVYAMFEARAGQGDASPPGAAVVEA